jgi:hypothetical protein
VSFTLRIFGLDIRGHILWIDRADPDFCFCSLWVRLQKPPVAAVQTTAMGFYVAEEPAETSE